MESGAKGCEVVVSGKLRGQRAKSMKFVDGLMIHSGEPTNDYVDTATRHVLLRQGMYVVWCIHNSARLVAEMFHLSVFIVFPNTTSYR
jgi:ribosomal protein S3